MTRRYPIGIQTFSEIRENNMAYVDKTALIYKIANGTVSNFLSRPRRFGKSLLVTTLQAYFEGREDLFKGLAIDKLEKDWIKYPVLHLDLSRGKYYKIENLCSTLNAILREYEEKYAVKPDKADSFGNRLDSIIKAANTQANKKVVILIDEYDAPMLDSNSKPELQKEIMGIMRDFFSPLKADEGLIRFVFLTGITKFSQLSIFSELNNIKNYSLDDEFGTICGFTKEELIDNFHDGIESLAKANGLTFDDALEHLQRQYDGYHFTPNCPNIYNPYSILNSLYDKKFDNYWFATGTPTFLLEMLQENNIDMTELEGIVTTQDQFDTPTDNLDNPVPVLYQSGYLTIKGYDNGIFTLGYPNEEVRMRLNRSMLRYIAPKYNLQSTAFAAKFRAALRKNDIDTAMKELQSFLAGFPYDVHHESEKDYQAILYTLFVTLGFIIYAEVRTAKGRIDLLLSTEDSIFVMELKLDKSADEAIKQIGSRDYAIPYKFDGRRIFKVGINFSTEKRTIADWKYEEVK